MKAASRRSIGVRFRGAALAAALALVLAGCKTELYNNLDQRDSAAMVAILLNQNIAADRIAEKGGTYVVRVEETMFAQAVDALRAQGLPREEFMSIEQIFPADGLITSPTAERARFIFALGQELSRTISEIQGVLSARVQVVLPENDPLRQDTAPSSASVVIHHDRSAAIDQVVPQIKMLVSNSIESLSYDKVSIALFPVLVDRSRGLASNGQVGLSSFVGIPMPTASVARARLLFGVALLAAAAAGAFAMYLVWRRREEETLSRPLPPAPAE